MIEPVERAPLLEENAARALWRIGWPVAALGVLRSGYFLADAYWAGRLGDDAPAALSAMGGAAFATWILTCLGDLAGVGTHALAARAIGGGQRRRVGPIVAQGLWLSLVTGVVLAIAARPLVRWYFALVGFSGPSFARPLALGIDLLDVLTWTSGLLVLHGTTGAAFRGIGDTRTPLAIAIVTLGMNAVLAPFLMFGWAGFPALGLAGAGWATAVANAFGFAASLWALRARDLGVPLVAPDLPLVRDILAIGAPQALSGVGFCLVYVLLGEVLTAFGPQAIAGLGLGHRIEAPSFQVCLGFASGAATLVGQNLGAKRVASAVAAANLAAKMAMIAMIPFTLAFLLAPRFLVGIWAPDAETVARGASYLVAVGSVLVFMALEVVYEGAFAGAGDTVPAMIVVLTLTAARIPVAAWLSRFPSLGIHGIWIAIAGSTAVKGVLLGASFRVRWGRRSLPHGSAHPG